jgi:2-phospho-L-lactate guanylyltransferase
MKAILIPVKEFHRSKNRLAPHFSRDARASLVEAMCADFFGVVAAARGAERVFVVSAERRALDLAGDRGWETIVEAEQTSESHSVDAASRHCAQQGVTALLRLPIDIPLATPADIEAILNEASREACVVLVPSREGTGTNALLRSPPDLFPSHFGPGSFALHVAEAQRRGARVKILHNPRIAIDVDELDDLRVIAEHAPDGEQIKRWLETNLSVVASGINPFPGLE